MAGQARQGLGVTHIRGRVAGGCLGGLLCASLALSALFARSYSNPPFPPRHARPSANGCPCHLRTRANRETALDGVTMSDPDATEGHQPLHLLLHYDCRTHRCTTAAARSVPTSCYTRASLCVCVRAVSASFKHLVRALVMLCWSPMPHEKGVQVRPETAILEIVILPASFALRLGGMRCQK